MNKEHSKQRDSSKNHQDLIIAALVRFTERDPAAAIRIARNNQEYFEDVIDDNAGNFYLFYGAALEKAGEFKEAAGCFEKSYRIREAVSGDQDWYTAVSKREYCLATFIASGGKDGREGLFEFVDSVEEGRFPGIDQDLLLITEGKTLYQLLMDQSDITDLNAYDYYLSLYERICDIYDESGEPVIKKRLARNLRGGFFLKAGDYIRAEQAFLDAVNCDLPAGVPSLVSAAQIKSNLLMVYHLQNDWSMAYPLFSELLEILETDTDHSELTEKDEYRIYSVMVSLESQSMCDAGEEERRQILSFLHETCLAIVEQPQDLPDCTRELAVFVISAVIRVLQFNIADQAEQQLFLDALEVIRCDHRVFPLDPLQTANLHFAAAILSWNNGGSRTEEYFTLAIESSGNAILPLSTRTGFFESYAVFSAKTGKYDKAVFYAGLALHQIEEQWKSCVRYMNDTRLMQILLPGQIQFAYSYAMLRSLVDSGTLYEKVLQFKELASLAGRERNRILYSSRVDRKLLKEIRDVQNRIAALETDSLFRDTTGDYQEEKEKLRKLEAVFAENFPEDNRFVSITLDSVNRAIPDNSVVVEYYNCALQYGIVQVDIYREEALTGFDVYVTQKKNSECKLHTVTTPEGEQIVAAAEEFVSILQAESKGNATIGQIDRADDVRAFLYKSLVLPVLPYLEGFETVYIALDSGLVNLPLEILYDEDQEKMEDQYTVVKIECARDFLYQPVSSGSPADNLIIGNPLFELREQDLGERSHKEPQANRSIDIDARQISQLPFSQMEVELVSKYLGSRYYTGNAASKQLLAGNGRFRIIHIATHGYFDLSESAGDSMYSSCLLFSGVCNWLRDGTVSEKYGNGVVTADEISRMDLKDTELVVLSSCLSGMNEVSLNKGFLGLIGAFSAAGVHYVISHLWEANDFSTAVLMEAFYYQYEQKKKSPPEALVLAKSYLKSVSIGDLKKRNWFGFARRKSPDRDTIKMLDYYESLKDEVRPFRSEAFWGGFACYQCY